MPEVEAGIDHIRLTYSRTTNTSTSDVKYVQAGEWDEQQHEQDLTHNGGSHVPVMAASIPKCSRCSFICNLSFKQLSLIHI